jgi:hypothetical protein
MIENVCLVKSSDAFVLTQDRPEITLPHLTDYRTKETPPVPLWPQMVGLCWWAGLQPLFGRLADRCSKSFAAQVSANGNPARSQPYSNT